MPRPPRYLTIGHANHVIGHSVGDTVAFCDDDDRRCFMELLGDTSDASGFDLYHYALIPNHFHLETSSPRNDSLFSLGMKSLLYKFSTYHREKYGRRGVLWQPRFRSFPVNTDAYLMTCGIYIDLNATRAGLADKPEGYRWSSAGHYLLGRADLLLTDNPAFVSISDDQKIRRSEYRRLVEMWAAHGPSKAAAKKFFRRQPIFYHPTLKTRPGLS